MTPAEFERRLRNLESAWRRLDRGELTGRNAAASDATRAWRYRELRDAVAADARTDQAPLCAFLDNHPTVAGRWDRIERRSVGLPS